MLSIQIHLDADRDGIDDEKRLLQNSLTWKREVPGPDGQTVTSTECFR